MSVILASTSPYRRRLLSRLGIEFDVASPSCDEDAVKEEHATRGSTVAEIAADLADRKAASLEGIAAESIVIGSDQIAHLDGRVLDKPGSVPRACEQLGFLAGRTHELVTAVTVRRGTKVRRHTDVTRLTLRPLAPAEIAEYVEADSPLDCCGSYKIESRGIALFDRVETEDPTAIEGLPLIAVARFLREFAAL